MDKTGRLIHVLQTEWKENQPQWGNYAILFILFFFFLLGHSQSRGHQTLWCCHRNPGFLDATMLLLYCGRSLGMRCMPCIARNGRVKFLEIRHWKLKFKTSHAFLLVSHCIPSCLSTAGMLWDTFQYDGKEKKKKIYNTVPLLGNPSPDFHLLWHWGNLARPEKRKANNHTSTRYVEFCLLSFFYFFLSIPTFSPLFPLLVHSLLPSPTQFHHWGLWAIWWRHLLLHLSQRQGNKLSHCLRWLDPGIMIHRALNI